MVAEPVPLSARPANAMISGILIPDTVYVVFGAGIAVCIPILQKWQAAIRVLRKKSVFVRDLCTSLYISLKITMGFLDVSGAEDALKNVRFL